MKYSAASPLFFLVLFCGLCGWAYFLLSQTSTTDTLDTSTYAIELNYQPFEFGVPDDRKESSFRVDWPPREPDSRRAPTQPPLLDGKLVVSTGIQEDQSTLIVRIELQRASSEIDRVRWNRHLAFPEYEWMSKVRVWDYQEKWLWPNLPFLLRAYGVEREQRYGGVDPGKKVDNDFAAVVIRPLDSASTNDADITAEWFPSFSGTFDKHSVVHQAISEDLIVPIPKSFGKRGTLGVWLVYADFLGNGTPKSWPAEKEFEGGILSFHSIGWQREDDGRISINNLTNEIPPKSTGVDWQTWLFSSRRRK